MYDYTGYLCIFTAVVAGIVGYTVGDARAAHQVNHFGGFEYNDKVYSCQPTGDVRDLELSPRGPDVIPRSEKIE